jgi:hypothetical protein
VARTERLQLLHLQDHDDRAVVSGLGLPTAAAKASVNELVYYFYHYKYVIVGHRASV